MLNKSAVRNVQKWGNSLAVRLPASLAKTAHLNYGTPIELSVQSGNIVIKPTGERQLTLDERLKMFDSEQHGQEMMAFLPVGKEKL